ncbi:MAG TPA: hypothetical protein VFW45_06520 [Candidatus Polarisedimenticolia bacterium]|nr:hypothetical protein [Candidatus Polarisedimenticolia bacterium]
MKYEDEPMKPKEHWLFWSGLVLGLALYQIVDTCLIRSPVLGANAHSTNERVAVLSAPGMGKLPESTPAHFSRFGMDGKETFYEGGVAAPMTGKSFTCP